MSEQTPISGAIRGGTPDIDENRCNGPRGELGGVAPILCARPNCGNTFMPTRKARRYCSDRCRWRDWDRTHPRGGAISIRAQTEDLPPARHTDPDTSHEAASSVRRAKVREVQAAILDQLRRGPMTDEELLHATARMVGQCSPSGLRTRRHELVASGQVEDSGETRPTASGRSAVVWRLALTPASSSTTHDAQPNPKGSLP